MVHFFMKSEIIFYYINDRIVFMENEYFSIYILTTDFNKYDIFNQEEIELLLNLLERFTTIEFGMYPLAYTSFPLLYNLSIPSR